MNKYGVANHVIWQGFSMILANSGESWILLKHLLQVPFIFQKSFQVAIQTHFPAHVAGCEKPLVAIDQCAVQRLV